MDKGLRLNIILIRRRLKNIALLGFSIIIKIKLLGWEGLIPERGNTHPGDGRCPFIIFNTNSIICENSLFLIRMTNKNHKTKLKNKVYNKQNFITKNRNLSDVINNIVCVIMTQEYKSTQCKLYHKRNQRH